MIAGNYKLSGDRVQFALAKYDHNRSLVIDPVLSYLTYLGGTNADVVGNTTYSPGGNTTQGVVVDQAGNFYVTGYTQSTDFPLQGPIQAATEKSLKRSNQLESVQYLSPIGRLNYFNLGYIGEIGEDLLPGRSGNN